MWFSGCYCRIQVLSIPTHTAIQPYSHTDYVPCMADIAMSLFLTLLLLAVALEIFKR